MLGRPFCQNVCPKIGAGRPLAGLEGGVVDLPAHARGTRQTHTAGVQCRFAWARTGCVRPRLSQKVLQFW